MPDLAVLLSLLRLAAAMFEAGVLECRFMKSGRHHMRQRGSMALGASCLGCCLVGKSV